MSTLTAPGYTATNLPPGATGGAISTAPVQTTPIAQTSPTPVPTQTTPSAPVATPQPTPVTVNVGNQPTQQTPTTQPQLTAPANGSVVDLLNQAGQDSSYTARQQLATQYGIQNYQGTAQQNTELAKKYIEAHNALKSTTVPQNAAEARDALSTYQDPSQETPQGDPIANFYDAFGSMSPVESSLYSQINQILSAPATTQSFSDQYQQLVQQQGIPALQTQLMNINNLMDGTDDSIRQEITAAGGSANENQVEALAAARNKTFLQQANQLQQQLSLKQDYVNQIMQFSQADRADVEKQVDQKLGLTTQLADLQDKMTNAAKQNFDQIISNVGYAGLAAALKNDPQQQAQVEKLLGLGKGALSDPAFLGQQDAGKVLGSASTGYFTYNPYTGETTPLAGGGGASSGSTIGSAVPGSSTAIPTLNGKPLTDAQSTTLGYAQRLNDSNKTITDLGSQFTGVTSYLGQILPNFLKSSDRQQYEQAERNFINAVLRRESGAAISPSEFDNAAKQYFPQPGDSDAVLNQKTQNRERVIGSLSQSANVPESYVNQDQASSGGSYQDYLKAIGQ